MGDLSSAEVDALIAADVERSHGAPFGLPADGPYFHVVTDAEFSPTGGAPYRWEVHVGKVTQLDGPAGPLRIERPGFTTEFGGRVLPEVRYVLPGRVRYLRPLASMEEVVELLRNEHTRGGSLDFRTDWTTGASP